MHRYVGIDVSLSTLEVADGRKVCRFANAPQGIQALLQSLPRDPTASPPHVVLEPTSTYHHRLHQALADAGHPVTLVNPARAAAFARASGQRAKTDKADARLLAAMGEHLDLAASPPPDGEQETLKALRRHLEWLERERTAIRNRMATAAHSPWVPPAVHESLARSLRQVEEEIARVTQELQTTIAVQPRWAQQVRLVESVKGIGWRSAVVVVSEMPPVASCPTVKQWAAFSGIIPAVRQSGKQYRSHLSRAGAVSVRTQLYLPAVSALRCNPAVSALGARLKERAKPGKVRVCAAMHMLLRQCYGVLKSGLPFVPHYHAHSPTP